MRAMVLVAVAVPAVFVAGCAATEPLADPDVPQFTTPAPPGDAEGRPVPPTCDEVASPEDISTILGILVDGQPQPVVGKPQQNIGRTARLDCYYGLPARAPLSAATVWIGLASYTDAESARHRVSNTVDEERAAGTRVSDVPVGADRGVLLRGKAWLVVAARGRTTAVVSVHPNLVREDLAGAMLGQLADQALTPHEPPSS